MINISILDFCIPDEFLKHTHVLHSTTVFGDGFKLANFVGNPSVLSGLSIVFFKHVRIVFQVCRCIGTLRFSSLARNCPYIIFRIENICVDTFHNQHFLSWRSSSQNIYPGVIPGWFLLRHHQRSVVYALFSKIVGSAILLPGKWMHLNPPQEIGFWISYGLY